MELQCVFPVCVLMAYLPFANDCAALRERPRCPSRTANESIKQSRGKRFIYSGERQVILYIFSCNIVQIHIGLIYIKHIPAKSSRTTRGQPRLSLFADWYTMCYGVQGQLDNLFRNTCLYGCLGRKHLTTDTPQRRCRWVHRYVPANYTRIPTPTTRNGKQWVLRLFRGKV